MAEVLFWFLSLSFIVRDALILALCLDSHEYDLLDMSLSTTRKSNRQQLSLLAMT